MLVKFSASSGNSLAVVIGEEIGVVKAVSVSDGVESLSVEFAGYGEICLNAENFVLVSDTAIAE